jgi:hypothetical protein
MVNSWVSGYFDRGNNNKAHTMNLMDRAIGILVPYLSMSNPQANIEARMPQLRPWAYTTELAMNHLLNEIMFSKLSLRPAIFSAMFGSGVIKTGIMKTHETDIYGNHLDVGQPYAAHVDDEDFIGDVSADSVEDFEMIGNFYHLPTAMAKEFFGPQHADKISPSCKLFGDNSVTEVVKRTVNSTDYHTLRSLTRFMDIYLPDERVIITMLADGQYHKILRTVQYDGPETGPYDVLGFRYAPRQSMPLPPAWGWIDMDTAMNKLINKMRNQAEREKSILCYTPEAADDAESIRNTPDGMSCKVDDVNNIKVHQLGGVNPESYNWVTYIEGQFSIQGGNLYQLGGRGSQAETLGQEQMLMTNASRIVDDMEQSVYDFTQSIFRKLTWYIWNDPLIQIPVTKRVEGAGSIDVIYDKYAQEGDWGDFNFKIKPYSMQRFNPSVEGQKLMQFLSAWVIPVMPMAAQQGVQVNVDAATKKIAEYLQLDIEDIWTSAVPEDAGMVGNGPYQPTTGQVKQKGFGQSDDRFGAADASRSGNSVQFQSSPRMGQPSPAKK